MNDETTLQELTESPVIDETQSNDTVVTEETAQQANQNDFVELDPVAQKKVNKLTWEKNEAKRESDKLKRRIEELEKAKPVEQAPTVQKPSEDLIYEDREKYDRQLAEHIRAEEAAKATAAANQQAQTDKQKLQQEQAEAEAQAKLGSFNQNATKLGLKSEDVEKAVDIVVAYQPSPDLANYLLEDPSGPQMVDYLANNQAELAELVQLNPYQAVSKLNDIKLKAAKKPVTSAPDPIQQIGGKGVPKGEHPALNGVTFE